MSGESGKFGRSKRFKYGLYGFVSDRGLNPKRVTNEDSYLLLEDPPLFAVADGVGGQNAGEVASQVVVEILKHQFSKKKVLGDKVQFLQQVVCYANRYLYDMAVDDEMLSGMATTLALVLLERRRATLTHVGDSRIYRFTAGKLYRETMDHSLAEDGRYGAQLGGHSVNKNIITRALGVETDVEPETKTIDIPPDTSFLLCTDGITRHVSDDELAEVLHIEPDPQSVCDLLREICYDRGAKDNLTAIMLKVDPSSRRGAHAIEDRADDSIAPDVGQKSPIARIQVRLQDRDQELEEGGKLDDPAATTFPESLTFSSQLDRDEGSALERSSRRRQVLIPLLLALALVVGFFAGIYVQPVLSPTSQETPTSQALSPAQQAFEEGRRAFDAGQYQQALAAFDRALNMSPGVATYHHWLAETQVVLKDYLAGAENFRKAASLSGEANDYLHAAAAYHAAGAKQKAEEALAAYQKAKNGQ